MEKFKGRIVNIEKHQNRAVCIKQGVQGSEQYKYDNYPACFKYENENGQRFMIYAFSAQTVLPLHTI